MIDPPPASSPPIVWGDLTWCCGCPIWPIDRYPFGPARGCDCKCHASALALAERLPHRPS